MARIKKKVEVPASVSALQERVNNLPGARDFVPPPSREIPTISIETLQNTKWDILKQGVTQGMLGTFMLCPQKADYSIKQSLTPAAAESTTALAFGDFFHRGLDYVYGQYRDGTFSGDVLTAVSDVCTQLYEEDKKKLQKSVAPLSAYSGLEQTSGVARALLQQYFLQWMADAEEIEWIDLERTFEVYFPICTEKIEETGGDPEEATVNIPVRGKFDGVFRAKDGKLWLFETKTKSRIDENSIIDKLQYELQVMVYLWAIKQVYGETPAGVLYNVVRRPMLKQGVKQSLKEFHDRIYDDIGDRRDFYFVRYYASITAEEQDEWYKRDFENIVSQMWAWSQSEISYRNSGACQMYNTNCSYMRSCAYGDMSYLKTKDKVFPELELGESSD